jgi:hypothetical protein
MIFLYISPPTHTRAASHVSLLTLYSTSTTVTMASNTNHKKRNYHESIDKALKTAETTVLKIRERKLAKLSNQIVTLKTKRQTLVDKHNGKLEIMNEQITTLSKQSNELQRQQWLEQAKTTPSESSAAVSMFIKNFHREWNDWSNQDFGGDGESAQSFMSYANVEIYVPKNVLQDQWSRQFHSCSMLSLLNDDYDHHSRVRSKGFENVALLKSINDYRPSNAVLETMKSLGIYIRVTKATIYRYCEGDKDFEDIKLTPEQQFHWGAEA